VHRVVGAVVVMGMICLAGVLHERMLRVRPAPHDTVDISSSLDSLPAATSVHAPRVSPIGRSPLIPPPSFHTSPLVFLSHAPADSLDLLPGIGPVLAARIVAARGVHGFSSWDEVLAVKGIGPRLIARWQALPARQ